MFITVKSMSWWKNSILRCLWPFLICVVLALPVEAGQPGTFIPSLNARVESLVFYESGKGFPPKKDRIYSTVFNQSQTRYINWELNLNYPKPVKRIEFPIHYKYYNPQGKILTEHHINSYIETNWTSSNHSGGYNAGTWVTGTYRVEVYIDGKMVTSGNFKVVSGKVEIPNKKGLNKKKMDMPDDLGEL